MKKHVQRFVYLLLAVVLLAGALLAWPGGARAGALEPLSSLAQGDTVTFAGYTWIVLDPGTGYLLMQGSLSYRQFDSNATNTFDPTSSTNVAYYLKNTFYNSLPTADRALIQTYPWTTGNETNESSGSVGAKIGLLSYSEYNTYQSVTGVVNSSYDWWLRTPYSGHSSAVCLVTTGGGPDVVNALNVYAVRPALYLNPGILVSGGHGGAVIGGAYESVSVLINSAAGGTVTGGGAYTDGTAVQVTATPNSGYDFTGWTDASGTQVSAAASYSFTMGTAATTLSANFQSIPVITVVNGVSFSVTVNDTGGTLTGTNTTYGTLTSIAGGNNGNVISGTLSGLSTTTPTDIHLGSGTIEVQAVSPPSTTLDKSRSFY